MEREIQFHSLIKDELIYEVKIRSETPASTVDGLRKQLRLLVIECPSEAVTETDLVASEEIKVISAKIQELRFIIEKYDKTKGKNELYRSKALGYHIFHRLTRVITEDPALLLKKGELSEVLEGLLYRVEKPVQVSGKSEAAGDGRHTVVTVHCTGDSTNVTKWNLKFDGTDPRSFLEKVDELKTAKGVSDDKFFSSVSQLFSDRAYIWYQGVKSEVSDWQQLKALILEEFDVVDFDYRLMSEIRSRTQGVDEPVHIYFSVMNYLFSRLKDQMSEKDKLEILMHNIRPTFTQQLAMFDVGTVKELKEMCRKLEAAQQRAKLFTEPSRQSGSVINPKFAYQGKAKTQVSAVVQTHANKNVKMHKSVGSYGKSNKEALCFKCGKGNHDFKTCGQASKVVRCYTCGELGYTKLTCPKCKKSINHHSKNL